ncbi:hypothetical protein FOXB_06999, partial [Fusarium oxysporum f. sp. conglutinans Fo5176]
ISYCSILYSLIRKFY